MKARKIRIPESNREKLYLFAKRTVSSNTCTIETSVQYLNVQIKGRQKATQ